MTWGLVSRLTALLAAVLIAPLAGVFGVPVSVTAVAAPAAYSSDAATHAYDGPARLSSPHSVARDARGSLSGSAPGPGTGSWVSSVSVGDDGAAANSGSSALATVPDFADTGSAFSHYAAHVKGVRLGPNGAATLKNGGADVAELGDFATYRSAARSLMSGPGDGTVQGWRSGGDFLRFDQESGMFGVLSPQGTIRTFFRPDDGLDYFLGQFK